jgi:hypothetical protein
MSWYKKGYLKRQIVGIEIFGGSSGVTTTDVDFLVPVDWDLFWNSIRSDFKDVVVCDGDGNKLTFQRKTGANYSTRTLTIEIDNFVSPDDDSVNAIFLYYHNPDESVDAAGSFTMGAKKVGYILLERPYGRIVPGGIGATADDQPIVSFQKQVADEIDVFFLFRNLFGNRISAYNDRLNLEELTYVEIRAYKKDGSVDASIPKFSSTRLGNGFVRARFKAGSDATDYAIVVMLVTTEGQVIESRAILRIKNLLPL